MFNYNLYLQNINLLNIPNYLFFKNNKLIIILFKKLVTKIYTF